MLSNDKDITSVEETHAWSTALDSLSDSLSFWHSTSPQWSAFGENPKIQMMTMWFLAPNFP